jgi:hypothetical protein
MSRLLSIAVENNACLGSIFLYHDTDAAKKIERWLADQGFRNLEYHLNGESGLVLKDNTAGESTVIRIAPYMSSRWANHMNRPWAPFTVQPTECRIVPVDKEQIGPLYSGDSLSVEIMPHLQPTGGHVDFRLAKNTGLTITSPDKDVAKMADGTLVVLDPDCSRLETNTQTQWPWRDYASRQKLLRTVHENMQGLETSQQCVVEESGVFFTKQEKLYGPDYLTRRRPFSFRPRQGHYAQRSPVDVLSL